MIKAVQRTGNTIGVNHFDFTKRERDLTTGYIDLINRQYDYQIGRFTSVDPITQDQENQSPFQYGWNNPVRFSDPDGLEPCCGGVIQFVSGAIDAIVSDNVPTATSYTNDGSSHAYDEGAKMGHKLALIGAGVEIIIGGTGTGAAVAGEVATVGGASPVAIPVATAGSTMVAHGVATFGKAMTNMNGDGKTKTHGNDKNSTTSSGNYTNTHESGKTYSGVGNEKRMNKSAERVATKHSDPVKNQKWQSAANKREAYIQEHKDIKDNGGAKNTNRNYNTNNSPGKKIVEQN